MPEEQTDDAAPTAMSEKKLQVQFLPLLDQTGVIKPGREQSKKRRDGTRREDVSGQPHISVQKIKLPFVFCERVMTS